MIKNALIFLIRIYQKYLSPYKSVRCPYYPTCSEYGVEAIEMHGAFKGGILTVWRILRCNPFSKGGVDPVPLTYKGITSRTISHTIGGK